MREIDFLILVLEHWEIFSMLYVLMMGATYYPIKNKITGGLLDPFALIFVVNYSINYAVIAFLVYANQVENYYALIFFVYGVAFLWTFRLKSKIKGKGRLIGCMLKLTNNRSGYGCLNAALFIYILLASYIVASIGFGIAADTNRFDVARGYGGIIRILDCLAPFIISFLTVMVYQTNKKSAYHAGILTFFY